jgi:tungstate transport system substrate-binding protein
LKPIKLNHRLAWRACLGFWACAMALCVQAQSLVLASTTSTEQSGLFAHLLPAFKKATGIDVRVVALGTGQALDMGRRGDADVLLVHDTQAEEKFVAEGWGLKRHAVMYNDFLLVGPSDEATLRPGHDIVAALSQLAAAQVPLISRGDRSGTHMAELRFWQQAGVDPRKTRGYRECGCGMGQALNMAAASSAYVLTDRGTWLSFRNREGLVPLVEGDARLFNPYGVIAVNPARHPHVQLALAQKFIDWLVSPAGQAAVSAYRIGGEPLFFPMAKP